VGLEEQAEHLASAAVDLFLDVGLADAVGLVGGQPGVQLAEGEVGRGEVDGRLGGGRIAGVQRKDSSAHGKLLAGYGPEIPISSSQELALSFPRTVTP